MKCYLSALGINTVHKPLSNKNRKYLCGQIIPQESALSYTKSHICCTIMGDNVQQLMRAINAQPIIKQSSYCVYEVNAIQQQGQILELRYRCKNNVTDL